MTFDRISRIGMAVAAAALAAGAATAATPTREYLMKAGASDLFEKKSSTLELQSGDPKIRDFAKQMIADHTKSTAMVKSAALHSGLHPKPPMLDAKQKSDYAALTAAHGGDRDQLYISQQKAAHQDALALQQDYADSGARPKLKMVASNIVPVVQHHIEMLNGM